MTPDQIGYSELATRKALYTIETHLLMEGNLSATQITHLLDAQRYIAAALQELERFAREADYETD